MMCGLTPKGGSFQDHLSKILLETGLSAECFYSSHVAS
jgi:hypothetical protein